MTQRISLQKSELNTVNVHYPFNAVQRHAPFHLFLPLRFDADFSGFNLMNDSLIKNKQTNKNKGKQINTTTQKTKIAKKKKKKCSDFCKDTYNVSRDDIPLKAIGSTAKV